MSFFSFFFHHVRGEILDDRLLAPLRGPDASLFQFEDAVLAISKEIPLHPFVDGKRDHLCDGGKARDWAVVCGVFSVSTLVDEDRPPFKEPVVLLVPSVTDIPFNHALHELEHGLLDGWALLNWE